MRFPGLVMTGVVVTAAAGSGIPPGGASFTIAEAASGRSMCLTRPASFSGQSAVRLSFRPCGPPDLNPDQEWRQPRTGPNGFGEILDASGDCIGPGGLLYQAGGQACQATALNVQWTQLPGGTVVDEEPPAPPGAPLYWDEPDPDSRFPELQATADPALAGTFTFTATSAELSRGSSAGGRRG